MITPCLESRLMFSSTAHSQTIEHRGWLSPSPVGPMSRITEIIGSLKEQWGTPRQAVHRGRRCAFLLACSFDSEAADTLEQVPLNLPGDIREFWLTTRSATLFKDRQFGQWGIEVLDPEQAIRQTSREM